jgi:hypothetical protein
MRQLPSEKFDFSDWVREFDDEHQCGTVCCAAGWLPRVDPEHWMWRDSRGRIPELISDPNPDVDVDLQEYFGIDAELVEKLFYPGLLGGSAAPAEWADHAESILSELESKIQEETHEQ